METITPVQMKELETHFMQETGVPGILLMEHAAQGVADGLLRHVPQTARVLFLCGPGNNGGDGYAAARIWQMRGGSADIWETTSEQRGDAKTNRDLALAFGVSVYGADDQVDQYSYDAFVDALFGTGLSRPVVGDAQRLLHAVYDAVMSAPRKPVIAVDIPSGLDGTTGEALGEEGIGILRCTETVTFHRIKQGLLLRDGPDFTGKITVCPLPIPEEGDIDADYGGLICLTPADMAGKFCRRATAHKGDFGRAVIFCGSCGMAGAAALCANAAMRTGAGLTNLLCRESLLPLLQTLVPCSTCTVLPEQDGRLTADAAAIARKALECADAACIGCGLGRSEDLLPLLKVFVQASRPVVWDADALNLLSTHPGLLPLPKHHLITPHFGEAARLLGESVPALTADPLGTLHRLQAQCGCTVLLKGARTLITDGEHCWCNLHGTPAMAKGGSGDVLSGILTALLARREGDAPLLASGEAAAFGAMVHGLAGLSAEEQCGENGVLATDLIDHIRLA